MLIFTPGTRFPRAVREPPRRKRLRGLPLTRFSRRSLAPYIPINFVLKDMSSSVYKLRRISRPSPSYLIKSRNYQDLDQHGDSDSIHQFGSFPLRSIRNRIQLSFRQYDVL
jgi:hypothetical protein